LSLVSSSQFKDARVFVDALAAYEAAKAAIAGAAAAYLGGCMCCSWVFLWVL
jgi:hypothetical protein